MTEEELAKIKAEVEALRTEQWTLAMRNDQLRKENADMEKTTAESKFNVENYVRQEEARITKMWDTVKSERKQMEIEKETFRSERDAILNGKLVTDQLRASLEIKTSDLNALEASFSKREALILEKEGQFEAKNEILTKKDNELKQISEKQSKWNENLLDTEARLIAREKELNRLGDELARMETQLKGEREFIVQDKIKLNGEKDNFAKKIEDFNKKEKDLFDKEKSLKMREFDFELEQGQFKEKVRIYRAKLPLDQ
jgi:chromosome segregation ATPase